MPNCPYAIGEPCRCDNEGCGIFKHKCPFAKVGAEMYCADNPWRFGRPEEPRDEQWKSQDASVVLRCFLCNGAHETSKCPTRKEAEVEEGSEQ